MAENKRASVPVASHGLHRHDYNFPWLSSIRFCEVMPCYVNTLNAGERDEPKAGLYSQLFPILHNAFATGRYNFKAIYVPFFRVWRQWTHFKEQVEFIDDDGVATLYSAYPYVVSKEINKTLNNTINGYTFIPNSDQVAAGYFDYSYEDTDTHYRVFTAKGARVFKILCALGMTPNFDFVDNTHINILAGMCYIKAFADYYFPNQYVNDSTYKKLHKFFGTTDVAFNAEDYLEALEICSIGFYDGSFFENCWDQPLSPNVAVSNGNNILPPDPINLGVNYGEDQEFDVSNLTGEGFSAKANINDGEVLGFSQWTINALKSASMWLQRHRLSGARLIDRFLVSRGIPLSTAENDMSYFMGQRNVEIEVSGVENNSNDNLGELAGRGFASSKDKPLSFKVRADADGIFLIIVHAIPDANFPVMVDGFTLRTSQSQTYHAEFDKTGPVGIPIRAVSQNMSGGNNHYQLNRLFGFGQNYWDEIQERPRLIGDFLLHTRGSEELSAYHTFRLFRPGADDVVHSFEFIRQGDLAQYGRLFYSGKEQSVTNDQLQLFLRWYGSQYCEKLPLGDSYEWDDDETNRRVNLVVNGSQK